MLNIVIPTHGRPDLLKRTLDSLAQCRLPSDYGGLFVVENGGRFGAEAIVAGAAPSLNGRYVYYPEANKSAALNHVLQEIQNDLIVFFDDDVRLAPETLCVYSLAARTTGRGTFFGGPLGVDYQRAPPDWLIKYLPASARGWRLEGESCRMEGPYFLGANWAAFACDLKMAGGFDRRVGPGGTAGCAGQESAMQFMLLENGAIGQYLADAMVWHYVPQERCSKYWTRKRRYKHAISAGLKSGGRYRGLLGAPWWGVRNLLVSLVQFAITRLRRDEELRFEAEVVLFRRYGFLMGCWLSRRFPEGMYFPRGLTTGTPPSPKGLTAPDKRGADLVP